MFGWPSVWLCLVGSVFGWVWLAQCLAVFGWLNADMTEWDVALLLSLLVLLLLLLY